MFSLSNKGLISTPVLIFRAIMQRRLSQEIWQVWERREIHTEIWCGNPKKTGNIGVNLMIMLKRRVKDRIR